MPEHEAKNRRRHSLYVKQNKAYQTLLAVLIIFFVLVSFVVINVVGAPSSSVWRDNVLIRMIIERNASRYSAGN